MASSGLALTARAFPAISLLQQQATELDYDDAVVVGEHEGEDSYRQALPEHEQHLVIEF